jgi:hypothetical protein
MKKTFTAAEIAAKANYLDLGKMAGEFWAESIEGDGETWQVTGRYRDWSYRSTPKEDTVHTVLEMELRTAPADVAGMAASELLHMPMCTWWIGSPVYKSSVHELQGGCEKEYRIWGQANGVDISAEYPDTREGLHKIAQDVAWAMGQENRNFGTNTGLEKVYPTCDIDEFWDAVAHIADERYAQQEAD